ncbi:MAG: precorrin-2 dehydrogenase/sirohydrochlorin ferrochelatase family protein [Bacteroidota bacterium]
MLYPVNIKLKGKKVIVIGGGIIAEEKIQKLRCAGADITVVSPDLTTKLRELADKGKFVYHCRKYQHGDLMGFFMVIAATNMAPVNEDIYQEGRSYDMLVNCVDDPAFCDFYVPAIVQRGKLQVTISSSGSVPFFSKHLRIMLEKKLYRSIGKDLSDLQKVRRNIIDRYREDPELKAQKFNEELLPEVEKVLEKIDKF